MMQSLETAETQFVIIPILNSVWRRVQVPVAGSMQTAAVAGNENPREVDNVGSRDFKINYKLHAN